MDEAVFYFGTQLTSKLEEAGHKPSKEEKKAMAARQRILDKVFGKDDDKSGSGFADPALFL